MLRRAEPNFAFGAAHHAGDGHGARRVGDHAHFVRERALDAVERAHFFARARPPHHDALLGQQIQIERVQGMAQFEHHVVGRIHHIVDRSLPQRLEALPQPVGRGPTFTPRSTRAV